jgi:glycosyltransferase involved in cell wall biosynthesis
MADDITIIVPHIPPRGLLLARLVETIGHQTRQPETVIIETDINREGAAVVRTRALMQATTDWVAFVDDDDTLLPSHLAHLLLCALEFEADVVWPWFEVMAGTDPFPEHRGRQWNPDDPHMFPITTLVRTHMAQDIGGFCAEPHPSGKILGEDHPFFLALSKEGAKFRHLDEITWQWWHNTYNTSGLPDRW